MRRSFIIDETSGEPSMHGRDEKYVKNFSRKSWRD